MQNGIPRMLTKQDVITILFGRVKTFFPLSYLFNPSDRIRPVFSLILQQILFDGCSAIAGQEVFYSLWINDINILLTQLNSHHLDLVDYGMTISAQTAV